MQNITRRKNESPSLFVMRAFAATVNEMDDKELTAMTHWLSSKTASILDERCDKEFLTGEKIE